MRPCLKKKKQLMRRENDLCVDRALLGCPSLLRILMQPCGRGVVLESLGLNKSSLAGSAYDKSHTMLATYNKWLPTGCSTIAFSIIQKVPGVPGGD